MRVVAIGGGVSSCTFASIYKSKHPKDEVFIIEQNKDILSRVLISGNGRANLFNERFLSDASTCFNNPSEYQRLIDKHLVKDFLNDYLNKINLSIIKDEEGRCYPYSNTAKSVKRQMLDYLTKLKVNIVRESKVISIDTKEKTITYLKDNKKEKMNYDTLYFGIGGVAYDRNKENYLDLFKTLNVKYECFEPGLVPLITKEKIPNYLVGSRLKCKITLLINQKELYSEEGEILFKKDGLSGISIFNASLFIKENFPANYQIKIDPFNRNPFNQIPELNSKTLYGILNEKISDYILDKLRLNSFTKENIIEALTFKINGKYPLKEAQISLGGIETSEIDNTFHLKENPSVIIGGESLNIHAICGGFNMGFAFLSGYKAGNN